MSSLEDIQKRRDAAKAKAKADHDARKAIDLEKIAELEDARGVTNVAVFETGFVSPDLPVLCAVRTPDDTEIKRYRATAKTQKDGSTGDSVKAASDLGRVCRIYPEDERVFDALLAKRPGIDVPMGNEAAKLSAGKAESEGKG